MHWRSGAALAGAVLMLCAGAQAEEGKEIDCGDTALSFDVPDFKVTCKDYSDTSALSNAGAMRVEVLTAISDARQQIIIAVDMRALGGIYLGQRGLEEDIRSSFSNEALRNWKRTEDVAGYEFAEYTGRDADESCIAFRRTMNRRNGGIGDSGFGRKVVGFGCTTESREQLVDSLKKLEAPGG